MNHPTQVLPARIANRVTVNDDGCWQWQGALNAGYGVAKLNGKLWRLHRLTWHNSGHDLIDGLVLDHICRNRSCCNPAHLRQVSIADNVHADGSQCVAAIRKTATHCQRGHELSAENVKVYGGYRRCMACVRLRS